MASFFNRVLDNLNRIYRFRGQQITLDEFDLSGPIQPTHDVSRLADFASGYGFAQAPGWWIFENRNTHVGSDTIVSLLNPRTAIQSVASRFSIPPDDLAYDVWLYDHFVWTTTTGIISSGNGGLFWPAIAGLTTTVGQITLFYDSKANTPNNAGSASDDSVGLKSTAIETVRPFTQGPILLPAGLMFWHQSLALAVAGDITMYSRCWVGPRGARPPGLA